MRRCRPRRCGGDAGRRRILTAAALALLSSSAAQEPPQSGASTGSRGGPLTFVDPLFSGCTVTSLGCYGEGADDPAGRKIPDPGSGGEIPLKLRSLPYGTACDVCDGGLNQCEEPPNAQGGHWPKAPSTAPACVTDKMDLEYCAKVCMQWFGRATPGGSVVHDVVYAGAQFGEQCWCMPTMFPATGVDVKEAENTALQCDSKCKADQQDICGGGARASLAALYPCCCWLLLAALCSLLSAAAGNQLDRLC